MTIASTTSKVSYNGSGSNGPFPITYKFTKNADLTATKRSSAGVETVLALTTDYTLTGAGDAAGGSLTLTVALAVGESLVIARAPGIVQEVDYVENSAFPAETHEAALDLLTMICQSLQEQIGRAVLYPVSTPDGDIMNSESFLGAAVASRDAARISEQNAVASAGQAAVSASAASASAGDAAQSAAAAAGVLATADGLVKVSSGDAMGQNLSAKLLAGNGLSEGIENSGGVEALRLAVALAASSGLEFDAGLLRIKAGAGLALSASGLAADVGTTANKLLQLDAQGRMPAVDGRNLTNLESADQLARDNAAMNAFIAHIQVGRVTGPMPKGGIWLFATDEMTKGGGAVYEAANKRYSNQSATVVGNGATLRASQLSAGYTIIDLNFALPTGLIKSARFYTTSAGISCKVKVFRLISGTQYSFVGESQAVTSVNGVNTIEFATPFAVQAGDRLALYSAGILANAYTAAGTAVLLAGDITSTQTFGGQAITLGIDATVITGTTSMTLTTPAGIALGSAPTKATLYLLHKALDALTYNTDIIVKASRGADYAAAPDLAALCQYDTDYTLLRATVDLSALASGSTGLWRIETTNKGQQVRAALAWFE